jgi:hypothetical protein
LRLLRTSAAVIHDRNDREVRKYLHALIDESIGFNFGGNG